MELVKGVEIHQLKDRSEPGDTRGPVFEWKKFTDKTTVQLTSYARKMGNEFGNHFHKGSDPSKNPELFLLISGEARIWGFNKATKERKETKIGPGTVLVIWPGVLHGFKALTDVVYVEPRVTEFSKENPDTFPAVEYDSFKA